MRWKLQFTSNEAHFRSFPSVVHEPSLLLFLASKSTFSMPLVETDHRAAVEKIARVFGLSDGTPAWKTLSVSEARRKIHEVSSFSLLLVQDRI